MIPLVQYGTPAKRISLPRLLLKETEDLYFQTSRLGAALISTKININTPAPFLHFFLSLTLMQYVLSFFLFSPSLL